MERPGVFKLPEGYHWRAGVLACSTSRARGVRPDESGGRIQEACRKWWRTEVTARRAVADDRREISRVLNNWCEQGLDVIFTTGGAGFSPTDVTPDATRDVIMREAPVWPNSCGRLGRERMTGRGSPGVWRVSERRPSS